MSKNVDKSEHNAVIKEIQKMRERIEGRKQKEEDEKNGITVLEEWQVEERIAKEEQKNSILKLVEDSFKRKNPTLQLYNTIYPPISQEAFISCTGSKFNLNSNAEISRILNPYNNKRTFSQSSFILFKKTCLFIRRMLYYAGIPQFNISQKLIEDLDKLEYEKFGRITSERISKDELDLSKVDK